MAEKPPGASPLTPFIFNFADRAEVRTFMENNEPEFVALDVAAALEYANPRDAISKHVDKDCVAIRDVTDALGRSRETNVVNEAGLYQLIMRSDKPAAKVFQRWVTHEVLPQLRKFGFYGFGKPLSANQTLAAQKLCVSLAKELVSTSDAGLREVIYSQLSHTSRLLNIPVPPMERLGRVVSRPEVPWVWVLSQLFARRSDYRGALLVEAVEEVPCVFLRASEVVPFLMEYAELRPTLQTLPVHGRALSRDLRQAGMVEAECERTIHGTRYSRLMVLPTERLESLGVDVKPLSQEV